MVYVMVCGPRAALVDVGSTDDLPLVSRGLEWLGIERRQVDTVIATHLHFDHVMGIDCATAAYGAQLALGEVSRAAVESGTPIRWPRRLGPLRAIPGWVMQGAPVMPKADRQRGLAFGFPWSRNPFTCRLAPTLVHEQALPGFEGWSVLATPGHSSDSICLHHAEAGILVAGDSVRNFRGGEWNGLTDDAGQYEQTKRLLQSLHVRVACPGHGPVLTGEGLLSGLATIGFWGRRAVRGQTT